jgi:hypothetical protein
MTVVGDQRLRLMMADLVIGLEGGGDKQLLGHSHSRGRKLAGEVGPEGLLRHLLIRVSLQGCG